jgi:hypothetical protein
MSISDFYSTASQVSFTLLGFWWAIVQFRYADWVGNSSRRRLAHVISLLFLVPGLISLLSMLSGDDPFLWRLSFGLSGFLSLVATLFIVLGGPVEDAARWLRPGSLFVAAPLFVLVTLFAIAPGLATSLLGLHPLQVEGILLSLIIFLGVSLAWSLFWEGKPKEVSS